MRDKENRPSMIYPERWPDESVAEVIESARKAQERQGIKARIRSICVDQGTWFEDDDPFYLYQQGKISKDRLIDLICEEMEEKTCHVKQDI